MDIVKSLRKQYPTGPGNRIVMQTMDEAADEIEGLSGQLHDQWEMNELLRAQNLEQQKQISNLTKQLEGLGAGRH